MVRRNNGHSRNELLGLKRRRFLFFSPFPSLLSYIPFFSIGGMRESLKTYFDFTTFTKYDSQQAGEENDWKTQRIAKKRDNLELLKTYQSKTVDAVTPESPAETKDSQAHPFMFSKTKTSLASVDKKKVCRSLSTR